MTSVTIICIGLKIQMFVGSFVRIRFTVLNEGCIQRDKFTCLLTITPEVRASIAFECSRGKILTWDFLSLLERDVREWSPPHLSLPQ